MKIYSNLGHFALLALLSLLFISSAEAEVEAVQIQLNGGSGNTTYTVPAGKVLILEHIIFVDWWDTRGEDKRIFIRHGGSSIGGPVWDTTQNYSSKWNQLLRPLRFPAGKSLGCPFLDDSSFKIFLYGRLADQADLFAKIDSKIKDSAVSVNNTTKTLTGTVNLASARPAKITLEESSDLKTWTMLDDLALSPDLSFALAKPASTSKHFVRSVARARPEELLPRQPLIFLPPFPF